MSLGTDASLLRAASIILTGRGPVPNRESAWTPATQDLRKRRQPGDEQKGDFHAHRERVHRAPPARPGLELVGRSARPNGTARVTGLSSPSLAGKRGQGRGAGDGDHPDGRERRRYDRQRRRRHTRTASRRSSRRPPPDKRPPALTIFEGFRGADNSTGSTEGVALDSTEPDRRAVRR